MTYRIHPWRRERRGLALLTALLVTVFVSVMTVGVFSFAFANYRDGVAVPHDFDVVTTLR